MVPVFRASHHIEKLLSQIQKECASQYNLEIILVDDFSNDETLSTIRALIPLYPNIGIVLIPLRRNMGQVATTAIGLAYAKNSYIITMDDDLQHHPKDISDLISQLQKDDLDFVVAKFQSTKVSRSMAIARGIAHRIATAKYRTPKNFGFSSFCAYRRAFIQGADLLGRPRIELGWMFELSQRYENVPLEQFESVRASSTHTLSSLFSASKPLFRHLFSLLIRPVAALGLISSVVAIATLVFRFWVFLVTGSPIPGFATLSILMLLSLGISGIFLFIAMTELREIRSLIYDRVSNSISNVESVVQE